MFRKTEGKGTPFENGCFDRKKQGGFYQSIISAVFQSGTTEMTAYSKTPLLDRQNPTFQLHSSTFVIRRL